MSCGGALQSWNSLRCDCTWCTGAENSRHRITFVTMQLRDADKLHKHKNDSVKRVSTSRWWVVVWWVKMPLVSEWWVQHSKTLSGELVSFNLSRYDESDELWLVSILKMGYCQTMQYKSFPANFWSFSWFLLMNNFQLNSHCLLLIHVFFFPNILFGNKMRKKGLTNYQMQKI